jgi:4-carboxymuconolactone decarboxylase
MSNPISAGPERLKPVPPERYDAAQREAASAFEALRGVPVFGPFEPLLHSPEVMTNASRMGEYLRYRSAIGTRLSEFVILLVARDWSQDFEWHVHAPLALREGVAPAVVDAIADGRRPDGMTDDEEACWTFTTELLRTRRVSDATYGRALARFGEKGVVDLAALAGYYSLLAAAMNTARTALPEGAARLPRFPD